jgi:hypothetical protein
MKINNGRRLIGVVKITKVDINFSDNICGQQCLNEKAFNKKW